MTTKFIQEPMGVISTPAMVADAYASETGIPDWATLFGSLDFCSCVHCRSVFSPAGYLVDILHFMNNRQTSPSESTTPVRTFLEVLFERRGDIGEIELTCKNTNTPMPYVDLVNEVLENAVAVNGGEVQQTTGTAEELSLHPEYVNNEAYKQLAGIVAPWVIYPWALPFDLWTEEARAYLEYLEVPRWRLMETLHQGGMDGALTDIAVACEHLGLMKLESDIVTGSPLSPPKEGKDFWDLTSTEWTAPEQIPVSRIMQQSGLSYEELETLLRAHFIDSDGHVQIVFPGPSCNLDEARLAYVTDPPTNQAGQQVHLQGALERMHRFVRLQRKLSWTAYELDKAIDALGKGQSITPDLLRLSHVKRLCDELKRPLVEMLAWWANIDTDAPAREERSLYDRLFQNKAVINPVDEAFALRPDGLDLTDEAADSAISDHIPPILAALGISADTLAGLLKSTKLEEEKLTLQNLSTLYRVVSLSRALKLKVEDFLSLWALTALNPFNAKSTEDTVRFVREVQAVRRSGFKIGELDYLLNPEHSTSTGPAPTEEEVAILLGEIRDGLKKIATETTFVPNPQAPLAELSDLARNKLAILLPPDQVDRASTLIAGDAQETAAVQNDFIDQYFQPFLNTTEAKANLVGDPEQAVDPLLKLGAERFTYVLEGVFPFLRRTLSRSHVIQKIGDALKLEAKVAEELLTRWADALGVGPDNPVKQALEVYFMEAFVDSQEEITAALFPSQFKTFGLLHKIALLLAQFGITAEELTWVFEHGPVHGWLDPNALAFDQQISAHDLYAAWARLRDACALRDELTGVGGKLFDLFEAAQPFDLGSNPQDVEDARVQLHNTLLQRTLWNEADVNFLVSNKGFDLSFPESWKDEQGLIYLRDAFTLIRKLGMSSEKLWDWANQTVSQAEKEEQVRSIKQAVKARYDDALWPEVGRPIRDMLREKQRTALVSYLVGNRKNLDGTRQFADANALFEHYLIDVEMSACQMTSRIKQAISSVQLFVQRALMSLEPEVVFTAADAREWKWMKNYRVWEANRKVLLYPENWIEPDLRDGKSPFFKDLENQLLQEEVTQDAVERALLGYLEKLDDVARLEVSGLYRQVEKNDSGKIDIDILHVFARTRGTPHVYYYRQRKDSAWTPWERVDVDIEGDHLVPIVYNRRLHIFWPAFLETAKEPEGEISQDEPSPPEKQYEIRMAWSQLRNGKWAPKKTSTVVVGPISKGSGGQTDFSFHAFEIDGDLWILAEQSFSLAVDRFLVLRGCDGNTTEADEPGSSKALEHCYSERTSPSNTYWEGNRLVQDKGADGLRMVVFPPGSPDDIEETVLNNSPSPFSVMPPHEYDGFTSRAEFFYEDHTRTFFVEPSDKYGNLAKEDSIPPVEIIINEIYEVPPVVVLGPVMSSLKQS